MGMINPGLDTIGPPPKAEPVDNDIWWDYLCPAMANIGVLKKAQRDLMDLGCDWAEAGRILSAVQKHYVNAAFEAAHRYEEEVVLTKRSTPPKREDGRVLPPPLFTKTQDKKRYVKYKDCPYTKGGHQGQVCFQEGDSCPECGWTL